MRRRTIGLAVASLLILIAGAAAVWLATFDLSGAVHNVVLQRVEAATGRNLAIGELTVAPSLTPTVVARNISLTNAPWSDSPSMITAERFEVQLRLLPLLLEDTIVVDRLVLSGADVLMERTGDGRGNWRFDLAAHEDAPDAPAEEARRTAPLLTDVRIENSRLRWRDHGTGRTEEIQLHHTAWAAATLDSAIYFQAAGRWHEYGFELAGETGALAALMERTAPWPVDISGHILDTTVDVAGFIGLDGTETDLGVRVVGEQLAPIGAFLGADLPGIELFRIDARVTTDAGRHGIVAIDGLSLQLAESVVTGRLEIDLWASPPLIRGSIESDHLDLPALAAAFDIGDDAERADGPRHLPLEMLNGLDAQLKMNASNIALGNARLGPASAIFAMEDARFALRDIEIHGGGGVSTGSVVLTAAPAPETDVPTGHLEVLLRSDGLDLAALLEAAGTSVVTDIDMDVEVSLGGRGRTVEDLLESLQGQASMIAENGQIRQSQLDRLIRDFDFLQLILPFWQHVGVVPLNCILGEMEIEDGIGTSMALLDSQMMSVLAEGTVDLPNASLDLLVDPTPKSGALSATGVPVRITGPIHSPTIAPDPGASIGRIVGGLVGGLLVPLNQIARIFGEAAFVACGTEIHG